MNNPASLDASGFVLVSELVPDALLEIRYFSTYNFIGERIAGYEQPVALLTREAALALRKASDALMRLGYQIKLYDAYRPQRAVDHFVRWGSDLGDVRMKPIFYPNVDKARLFALGYIAARSSHSRGSTVDLTLIDRATGRELDMGGVFDDFSERSHVDFPGLTEPQRAARGLFRRAMTEAGFRPYENEWWHFTLEGEPYPDTFFDFPVSENALLRRGKGTAAHGE